MENIKPKNAEMLNSIMKDLKSLKTNIADIKTDISTIKNKMIILEMKNRLPKEEEEPKIISQSGWFF